jgi:ABC-2 type transport system ATP-binding protein
MKIISCYIPATAGSVSVCGFDTARQSMDVRRNIGYLPEHNPLYKDLYVKEYLSFFARLHKLAKPMARISELIELTGLGREQHKQIGTLSKGYRQRVGLAQAMLHDPQVLILDEPTSGLDPNQLAEIRALIKSLGKAKTVIFSTHIMQEVEAICDRVIIIDHGKIVTDKKLDKLVSEEKEQIIEVEFDKTIEETLLAGLPNIKTYKSTSANLWILTFTTEEDMRPKVFDFAHDNGLKTLQISLKSKNLEEIFREKTKK